MLYDLTDTHNKTETVLDIVKEANGVFGVVARKKNGETRAFAARLYDDSFRRLESHGLVNVRELNAAKSDEGYRSFYVDKVDALNVNGDTYLFNSEEK